MRHNNAASLRLSLLFMLCSIAGLDRPMRAAIIAANPSGTVSIHGGVTNGRPPMPPQPGMITFRDDFEDEEGVPPGNGPYTIEVAESASGPGGSSALGRSSQRGAANFNSTADTLSFNVGGALLAEAHRGSPPSGTTNGANAGARGSFSLGFMLTDRPYRYQLAVNMLSSSSTNAQTTNGVADVFMSGRADSGGGNQTFYESFVEENGFSYTDGSSSGILQPGTYSVSTGGNGFVLEHEGRVESKYGISFRLTPIESLPEVRWINPAGGSFHTAGNWTPSRVPGGGDTARFDLPGSYTVLLGQDVTTRNMLATGMGVNPIINLEGNRYTVTDLQVGGNENDNVLLTFRGEDDPAIVSTALGVGAGGSGPSEVVARDVRVPQGGRMMLTEGTLLHVTGSLTASNGGRITSAKGILDGTESSPAIATLQGAGSQWTLTDSGLDARTLIVGWTGHASLTMADGAVLDTNTAVIGDVHESDGRIEVAGAGSKFSVLSLLAGFRGHGAVEIHGGGEMKATVVRLAGGNDGSGAILVRGAGSKFRTTEGGSVVVGSRGLGTFDVRDGATAEIEILSVGSRETAVGISRGDVSIQGTGTTVESTSWNIGIGGIGTVRIGGGAVVDVASGGIDPVAGGVVAIGLETSGDGTLEVRDTGSKLSTFSMAIGVRDRIDPNRVGTGLLRIIHGAEVELNSLVEVGSRGTVQLINGKLSAAGGNVAAGGVIQGTGTLSVPAGYLVSNGTVDVGNSPGLLTINGGYQQTSSGDLQIEIGGYSPGINIDQLVVTGDAILDGTLVLKFIDGLAPRMGDRFDIITVGESMHGAFDNVEVRNLAPGFQFELSRSPDNKTFSMIALNDGVFAPDSISGDYNEGGIVDAADYVVWRKNNGTQQGYDNWRHNFGRTAGAGSLSHLTVPEPANWILLVFAVVVRRWRRHRNGASLSAHC